MPSNFKQSDLATFLGANFPTQEKKESQGGVKVFNHDCLTAYTVLKCKKGRHGLIDSIILVKKEKKRWVITDESVKDVKTSFITNTK